MDIDQTNFWPNLLLVIETISRADFVAFDLEMTGVSMRTDQSIESFTQHLSNQGKAAAQTFNILQVGISCASYDDEIEAYRLYTFNFQLTPVLGQPDQAELLATKIPRNVSVSLKSMLFLESHGYRFDTMIHGGVSYLSQDETKTVQELHHRLPPNRDILEGWKLVANPSAVEHAIKELEYYDAQAATAESPFTSEPDEPDFEPFSIKVVELAAFRYVIEALLSCPFACEIYPELISPKADYTTKLDIHARLLAAEDRLRTSPPILIGHNPLFDICFLYETFIGTLPNDVAEFTKLTHEMFPRLVDTKYFTADEEEGDRNLHKLYGAYKWKEVPAVVPKERGGGKGMPHQAGWDSYMTMVVFLKAAGEMVMERGLRLEGEKEEILKEGGGGKEGVVEVEDVVGMGGTAVEEKPSIENAFAKLNPFGEWYLDGKTVAKVKEKEVGEKVRIRKKKDRPIPAWETEFWAEYGNKIGIGGKEILDL